jgi:hypothetical protein
MKTHLVANFIWRTMSVKQANLKSRNRLYYYCQLFALFWVMPVRTPRLLNQVQGCPDTDLRGPFPMAPAGRAIVQQRRIPIPGFAHFPQQPGWRQEPRPVPVPEPFPARQPASAHVHSFIFLIYLLITIAR